MRSVSGAGGDDDEANEAGCDDCTDDDVFVGIRVAVVDVVPTVAGADVAGVFKAESHIGVGVDVVKGETVLCSGDKFAELLRAGDGDDAELSAWRDARDGGSYLLGALGERGSRIRHGLLRGRGEGESKAEKGGYKRSHGG